eukprot:scaffold1029_cov364-Pinguiococcus_pyrenoidosus.AAC.8
MKLGLATCPSVPRYSSCPVFPPFSSQTRSSTRLSMQAIKGRRTVVPDAHAAEVKTLRLRTPPDALVRLRCALRSDDGADRDLSVGVLPKLLEVSASSHA